jgi:ElaA protein
MSAAPAFDWQWRRFADLSGDDVYDMLSLRSEVFVVEQQCVFADADGCDRASWHLLGRVVEQGGPPWLGAYLRCIDPGVRYPEPSIGRVVVSGRLRDTGSGRVLMTEGIARSRTEWPGLPIVIGAQQRLEAFYGSLGFAVEGMPYDEDGILHVQMRLAAAP